MIATTAPIAGYVAGTWDIDAHIPAGRPRHDGDDLLVDGGLTLHGITRQVSLAVELTGFGRDPYGVTRLGLSATTKINRKEFGIDTELPLDGGGVVIGDTVQITLNVEAVLVS